MDKVKEEKVEEEMPGAMKFHLNAYTKTQRSSMRAIVVKPYAYTQSALASANKPVWQNAVERTREGIEIN
jgi:hypothetical protein